MKKLLHIIATPREEESRTLKITEAFLESFRQKYADWVVEELNLAKEELPSLNLKMVSGKYALINGKELFGELKQNWKEVVAYIDQFMSADGYLITAPMWNFSIPYMLKHYIDLIVQPTHLFRYTEHGTEGLVKGKKMVVISTYGGAYTTDQTKSYNFHEPYLRTLFGFVGITEMTFIVAQPMDMGKEVEQKKVNEAIEAARRLEVFGA
jgi:FMN-dependent NADH-azoreductase